MDPITHKPLIVAKIGDFGTAIHIEKDETLHEVLGTLGYIAPEVFSGSYSFPADIFSYAVICWITFSQNRTNPMSNFTKIASAIANTAAVESADPKADEVGTSFSPEEEQLDKMVLAAASVVRFIMHFHFVYYSGF